MSSKIKGIALPEQGANKPPLLVDPLLVAKGGGNARPGKRGKRPGRKPKNGVAKREQDPSRPKKPRPPTAKEIERQAKMKEALELRLQCYTFDQIAEQIGVSQPTAYRYVCEAMAAIPRESAIELRNLEVARVDVMMNAVFAEFMMDPIANTGMIDTIVKLQNQRGRYTGIFYAERINEGTAEHEKSLASIMAEDKPEYVPPQVKPDEAGPANPVM